MYRVLVEQCVIYCKLKFTECNVLNIITGSFLHVAVKIGRLILSNMLQLRMYLNKIKVL